MKILYFETDIDDYYQVEKIRDRLNHSLGFREWSFDLEHPDRVFKVEVLTTTPEEIIDLLKQIGIKAKEI